MSLPSVYALAQNPSGLQIEWADSVELRMSGFTEIANIDEQYIYLYKHTFSNGFQSTNWEFVVLYKSSLEVAWKYRGEPRTIDGQRLKIVHAEGIDGVFRIVLSHISPETNGMKLHLTEVSENGLAGGYLPLAHFSFDFEEANKQWLMGNRGKNVRSFDFIYKDIYQDKNDSVLDIQRYDENYKPTRVRVNLNHNISHTRFLSFVNSDEGESFLILEYSNDADRAKTLGIYKYNDLGVSHSCFINIPANEWSNHWFNINNGNIEIGTLAVFEDRTMKASIQTVSMANLSEVSNHSSVVPKVLIERMKGRWDVDNPEKTPFVISNLRSTSDGGSMITFQIQVHEDRDMMTLYNVSDPELTSDHYLKDLLTLKVTANSKVQWFSHIPLDQRAIGFLWSAGATFFHDEERQYILLNDDGDNLISWAQTFPKIDYMGWRSIRYAKIVLVTIGNDGTVYYEHLGDSRDEDEFTFGPSVSMGTEDGEVFLLRYSGNKRLEKLRVSEP
ncbi:MAG: hypothetical protein HWE14_10430 [Flavobacteriia bacterium]|nr:hypothetical protein [Flavobacteriia bacterium]